MVRQIQSALVVPAPWQPVRLLETFRGSPRLTRAVLTAGWIGAILGPMTLLLVPESQLWERAHFSLTASACMAVVLLSWNNSTGRTRVVRGWIAAGAGVWTLLHSLKNVEYSLGALPVPPEALLVGIAVVAAGAYQAVAERMTWREQLAVYLDAGVVTAAAGAALVALFAERAMADPQVASLVVYAIVFVAIVAATMILDLAVLAELKLRGAYALLAGLAMLGLGFIVRAGSGAADDPGLAPWLSSAGVIVIAYGTATWNDLVDPNRRYAAVAAHLRNQLPLAAAVFTLLLLLVATPTVESVARAIFLILVASAVIGVVVRQSLLLGEREGVLRRLASARAAAERRTQQIAGMEAVGRLLAAAGPTTEVLDEVVEVIRDRFGYAHVAVYVSDGPVLRLGAQRGYDDLYATLDGLSGVVGRVARTQRAELVRDVSVDPDYLMASPDVRSEICAPLVEGGEFLGVLDVESSSDEPLDETDLAAVVAVADQVAGAIALGLRRQRLLGERNFTSAVLDTVGALIIVTAPDGSVVRFNPACAEASGYSMDELSQLVSFMFLVPAEQRDAVSSIVSDVQTAGVPRSLENDWVRRDGTRRTITWSNRPVFNADGGVDYVIATGIDVTERKRLEVQLAHRALHDPLTGLPNRALLMDRLGHALRRRPDGSSVAVLFIDLDDFKPINDTLGHDAGDLVLVEVAHRLVGALRPEDTAARVGGDEFAIVVENLTDAREALDVADRVRAHLSATEIMVNHHAVTVDASIGVAMAQRNEQADALVRNADIAMYAAKTAGGARVEVFRAPMYARLVKQRDLQAQLAGAIARDELVLHYQPIVRLRGQALTGAEALLRWQHPDMGLLLPAQFLALADAGGLIVTIGEHVLRQACRQMAAWAGDPGQVAPEWVSVNVSPRQFQDGAMLNDVRAALDEADLDPHRLVLEITENLMVDGSGDTTRTLKQLADIGVRFAVDDFGTGYSSLSYLRRFPIEFLKIDQSFIPGVDTDDQQAAFVGALIAMGRTLGLRVLAEGIESAAQYRALRLLGCELGQGFFIGRPVIGTDLRSEIAHAAKQAPAALAPAATATKTRTGPLKEAPTFSSRS